MSTIKCKMCGGTLEINANQTVAVCEYCGTQQTLPKSADEVITNLFNRANNLRLKCEFDKAEEIYEKIITVNSTDSEAYWGIVLCKYGIEYVEDPATFERVPTCHRTQIESIYSDVDYQSAINNADIYQKRIYEQEAAAIDRLQKDVISIANSESEFDVFLCYKETDENGKRTIDSVIANDIYHHLTMEGFKVFYAAITLEDKLGREYEPYIFAALNSAKVMLVIGTKPEYFNAVWVKNEWARYLKLLKSDRSRLLIPCYRDMDAYELPEEFSHLQSQDMSRVGFVNDIVRGIKKVVSVEAPIYEEKAVHSSPSASGNISSLLKRAFLYLEDGEWKSADEYCERVLDIDPENARAYLGKLLVATRCQFVEDLKHLKYSFISNNNYAKIMRFGDDELKAQLAGYIEYINVHYERERIYKSALEDQLKNTIPRLTSAIEKFNTIPEYMDASEQIKICQEMIAKIQRDIQLQKDDDERLASERRKIRNERANAEAQKIAELKSEIDATENELRILRAKRDSLSAFNFLEKRELNSLILVLERKLLALKRYL